MKKSAALESSELHKMIAASAIQVAVWSCRRQLRPFNYSPSSSTIAHDPRRAAGRLREGLVQAAEQGGPTTRTFWNSVESASSLLMQQLAGRLEEVNPQALAALATSFNPGQYHSQLIELAIMIRHGRPAAAEHLARSALSNPLPSRVRSRFPANLAMIMELCDQNILARRYASESVQCPSVSPLAVQNYRLYCAPGAKV